jgi:branched-chain amino acid transport system ATP-binding protein
MSSLLSISGLCKNFGGVEVAKDIDFTLGSGHIHCLIGPNGAGKSTFFKLVLGQHKPSKGKIFFDGQEITKLSSYKRIERGISVKFQVPSVFHDLSVHQNLQIALQRLYFGHGLKKEAERILNFIDLEKEAYSLAGNLSHGQKQWLEIGMAISLRPKLLMLDEPTAGMSPDETYKTGKMIQKLNSQGMSILAVEHDMTFVKQVAQSVTVLHLGKIFAQGSIEEIVRNERVAEIYLGKVHAK